MKISEFAKKHNVSLDTVRHYLDLDLLLSEKVGSQYSFNEIDNRDMVEIMDLKGLNFSLSEIQKILTYRRLASNRTEEFRNHFLLFLQNKRQEITKQYSDLEQAMSYIEGKIFELEMEGEDRKIIGIPIKFIDSLSCPNCKTPLGLSSGTIESGMIITGTIECECRFRLNIRDGIIIDESSVRKKDFPDKYPKQFPSKKEYYEKTPVDFLNFLFKSIASLKKLIQRESVTKKYILEISSIGGFLLTHYLPYLPKDATYIVIEHDYQKIKELKNKLELNCEHKNVIFLCSDFNKLPLSNQSVDLVIDVFSTHLHAEAKGKLLFDSISPLIRNGGHLAGIYSCFDAKYNEIKNISEKDRGFYNKDNILKMLKKSHLIELENKVYGPINEGGVYNPYVEGNNYCHLIYLGKKEEH